MIIDKINIKIIDVFNFFFEIIIFTTYSKPLPAIFMLLINEIISIAINTKSMIDEIIIGK
jgi:hypothetical protein